MKIWNISFMVTQKQILTNFVKQFVKKKIWYFTIIFNNPSEILLWHISNNSNNNHKNYNNLHAMW